MTRRHAAWLSTALLWIACSPSSEIDVARALQDRGDFARSIPHLESILADDAPHAEAGYRLGVALSAVGRPGEALWPLLRAAESESHAHEAGLALARTLLDTRNFEAAIATSNRVLVEHPKDPDAARVRALAQLGAGQTESALDDIDALLARFADDLDLLAQRAAALERLERLDEAERAFETLAARAATSGDREQAVRGCVAVAAFQARRDPDGAAAQNAARDCVERHPEDVSVLRAASALHAAGGRDGEATELLRRAVAVAPHDLELGGRLAAQLERSGEIDTATELLRETAEREDSGLAWQLLASHHRRHGERQQAQHALERALATAPEEAIDAIRFQEVDLLIELGRLDRAEERLAGIDDVRRQLLRGRIDLERGDAAAALASLDAGLQAWPDHAGARVLAARAAVELGDPQRALAEYRAAFRADRSSPDTALAAARLHLALGEPESALMVARLVTPRGNDAASEAPLLIARALAMLGEVDQARRVLDAAEKSGKDRVPLLLERAFVAERTGAATAAVRVLEESGLDWADPDSDPALAVLLDALARADRDDRALAIVDAAIATRERSRLHDLRGRLLLRAGRTVEAGQAFERASALDADAGAPRIGLALVAARSGDREAALRRADEALARDDLDAAAHYSASQVFLWAGRFEQARDQLEAALRLDPGHLAACDALARLLADEGDRRALALAERALRIGPPDQGRRTLAYVRTRLGIAEGG
jgi:tetratricopeptide (TPR) repeat protein